MSGVRYPLATEGGIRRLTNILAATDLWRGLTKPQRELLLSTLAGYPIAARSDVTARLTARGLLTVDGQLTDAARAVMAWRLP